jgi:hypothetical protein
MDLRRTLANILLLSLSLMIGLVVCEGGARQLLNPADYLSVETVGDDVLGVRIRRGTAGFDELGFRNAYLPSRVDVLTVGDSHTYGNNATMLESWPMVVGSVSGLRVYNLGMGGYGPNQYYELLRRYLPRLKPEWVLCGLYMGDDFENAYRMTYGLDYWRFLRQDNLASAEADIWEQADDDNRWGRRVRVWLSRHSLVYQLVVHGPVLGRVKGYLQIYRATKSGDEDVVSLTVKEAGLHEAFRPLSLVDRLDQRSPVVQEGMRITFDLLQEMNQLSRENDARFVVVIIPTKETVFANYLLGDPETKLRGAIDRLVSDEQAATASLVTFLERAGIPHVEVTDALREQVSDHLYTQSDRDMHPASGGYRIIGDTVARFLKKRLASSRIP